MPIPRKETVREKAERAERAEREARAERAEREGARRRGHALSP